MVKQKRLIVIVCYEMGWLKIYCFYAYEGKNDSASILFFQ